MNKRALVDPLQIQIFVVICGPTETSLLKNIYLIDFFYLRKITFGGVSYAIDRKSIKLYFKIEKFSVKRGRKKKTFPKQKSINSPKFNQ